MTGTAPRNVRIVEFRDKDGKPYGYHELLITGKEPWSDQPHQTITIATVELSGKMVAAFASLRLDTIPLDDDMLMRLDGWRAFADPALMEELRRIVGIANVLT